jgi:DnaJ-class molecular chaperone
MNTNKSKININDFFCPDDMRSYLATPFQLNGRTIASTGHVLASFPKFGEFPDCDKSRSEDIQKIVDSIHIDCAFVHIPDNLKLPDQSRCGVCDGTGKVQVIKCQECDGSGEVEFDNCFNSYEAECKSCDGEGESITKGGNEDCENCNGSGLAYLRSDYVDVLGVIVNPKLLNLIINVEGIGVFPLPEVRRLLFKCGDVRGAIMGMVV